MSFGIATALRNGIDVLNSVLHKKCNNKKYNFVLKRYAFRDTDSAVYHEDAEYDIILCLNYNGRCISSVSGLYHDGKTYDENTHYAESAMEIISKTNPEYEGKRMNLYLRCAFLYLMYFIRAKLNKVVSFSKNPISTYTMCKHFGATNDDLTDFFREQQISSNNFTIDDIKNFHNYFNQKYSKTREDIIEELNKLLDDEKKLLDNEQTEEEILASYGWETREDAIEFLRNDFLNSMPYSIPLEVNLDNKTQNDWLMKLETINIDCEKESLPKRKRTIKSIRSNKKTKTTKRTY